MTRNQKRYGRFKASFRNWHAYFINKLIKKNYMIYKSRNFGFEVHVPKILGGVFKELYFDDFYRDDFLFSNLPDQISVLDIGSNVGYFSTMIADSKKRGTIISFEPVPKNFKLLEKHAENINKSNSGFNVIPVQKAVAGPDQNNITMNLNTSAEYSVVASAILTEEAGSAEINIACTNIPDILKEFKLENIDLLKMDCEGSEYDIFYNLPQNIIDNIGIIAMEVHDIDDKNQNCDALVKFLNSHGYKTDLMDINDKQRMLYAKR